MILQDYLKQQALFIENVIDNSLPTCDTEPELIHEAMRYSCLEGGKRLRAILTLAACEAVGGKKEDAQGLAAALEMIHAYSLIHDDLPCMDDDDFRRGKPTNHKVFGEAIAVLAGDALLTQAMEELSRLPINYGIDPQVSLQIISEVTKACGSQGLIGGQVLDIISQGTPISGQTLQYIHRHKTGDLFIVALRGGALIGGANQQQLAAVTEYAENFGLAFQITDDILDVVGDEAVLGKSVGSDVRMEKATYPGLYGLDQARVMARTCVANCRRSLEELPAKSQVLAELAQFVLDRDY